MTDSESIKFSSDTNIEKQPSIPAQEKPEIDLKNELTNYFFYSMLDIIVEKWEQYFPEGLDSIPSKEEIITPTGNYVRLCEDTVENESVKSVESEENYSSSISQGELKYSSLSTHNLKRKLSRKKTRSKKNLKKHTVTYSFSQASLVFNPKEKLPLENENDFPNLPTHESVIITFRNGNRYEGPVFGKLMHGHGTFYWTDGSKYTGEFQNGFMTGKGSFQYSDGSTYEGEVYKNYRHGIGTMYAADTSAMYHGQWQAGNKNGHGWQLFEPNNWYDGEWKNNNISGYGLRMYSSGSQYQGMFDNNNRHGNGCAVFHNNDIYVGKWRQGARHGYGEYTWNSFLNTHFSVPIHNKYNGLWKNNYMHGSGIINFGLEGGIRYIGHFKDNLKHGPGMILCQNGSVINSNPLFVNDKPVHYKSLGSLDISSYETSVQSVSEDQINEINEGISHSDLRPQSLQTEILVRDDENLQYQESVLNILRRLSAFKFGIRKDKLASIDVCKLGFQEHKQKNLSIKIPIHEPCEQIELNFFVCKVLCKVRETIGAGDNKTCSKYGSHCIDPRKHSATWASLTSEQRTSVTTEPDFCYQYCNEEERLMRKSIYVHLSRLWEIYRQYSDVACLKVMHFRTWMMRICLWQMYRDFKIPDKISLADIDKWMSERMCFDSESIHYPFEIIYFWQYLHSLIRVAWELYGNEFPINIESNENGILRNVFEKFLENDVFPNCRRHTGSVLFDYIDVLPMDAVYGLYKSIGEPHSAYTLLNYCCSLNRNKIPPYYCVSTETEIPSIHYGVNAAPFSAHIDYLPHEPPHLESDSPNLEDVPAFTHDYFLHKLMFLRSLGPKTILNFIKQICPAVGHDKQTVNIDYKLTFLEFYEIILLCCQRLIDIDKERIEKKRISAQNKLIAEEERILRIAQEAETNVSLEKGMKKKGKLVVKTHSNLKTK